MISVGQSRATANPSTWYTQLLANLKIVHYSPNYRENPKKVYHIHTRSTVQGFAVRVYGDVDWGTGKVEISDVYSHNDEIASVIRDQLSSPEGNDKFAQAIRSKVGK